MWVCESYGEGQRAPRMCGVGSLFNYVKPRGGPDS